MICQPRMVGQGGDTRLGSASHWPVRKSIDPRHDMDQETVKARGGKAGKI